MCYVSPTGLVRCTRRSSGARRNCFSCGANSLRLRRAEERCCRRRRASGVAADYPDASAAPARIACPIPASLNVSSGNYTVALTYYGGPDYADRSQGGDLTASLRQAIPMDGGSRPVVAFADGAARGASHTSECWTSTGEIGDPDDCGVCVGRNFPPISASAKNGCLGCGGVLFADRNSCSGQCDFNATGPVPLYGSTDCCASTRDFDCLGYCDGTGTMVLSRPLSQAGHMICCTVPGDCEGICQGAAAVDTCGVCAGGFTGLDMNADVDCAGVCFGGDVNCPDPTPRPTERCF